MFALVHEVIFGSYFMERILNVGQGEELKRAIGAAVYIECSSKTHQVCSIDYLIFSYMNTFNLQACELNSL